ncbi:hypothetical protein MMC25_003436 [Agyrium rufum]|nr:hypothetical protein [Agyrium rufum]
MIDHEDLLISAARSGSMDYSQWPQTLDELLSRLEQIVHSEFEIPIDALPSSAPINILGAQYRSVPRVLSSPSTHSSPPTSQKENAPPPLLTQPPTDLQTPPRASLNQQSTPSNPTIPNSQPAPDTTSTPSQSRPERPTSEQFSSNDNEDYLSSPAALPAALKALLQSITRTLQTAFSSYPPHTVQRLAELILYPTRHYKTLPSYLRAVDRVVSVSSTANTYPLPSLARSNGETTNESAFLASNTGGENGSDFNGAALTPIPWLHMGGGNNGRTTNSMGSSSGLGMGSDLRTESTAVIDGPNGVGSLETVVVSMNGGLTSSSGTGSTAAAIAPGPNSLHTHITTADLDEGEDIDAEDISMDPSDIESHTIADTANANGPVPGSRNDDEADEEMVHARGPEEIGMEDMGPQRASAGSNAGEGGMGGTGLDLEGAVGRRGEGISPTPNPLPIHAATATVVEDAVMGDGEGGKTGVEGVRGLEEGGEKDAEGDILLENEDGN